MGTGGSMSKVVGSNNSYKPITNTVWVRAQICKLQKKVHSTRSRKWYKLPVACPGTVILSTTKTGRHDIAESGVKHQNSNNNQ